MCDCFIDANNHHLSSQYASVVVQRSSTDFIFISNRATDNNWERHIYVYVTYSMWRAFFFEQIYLSSLNHNVFYIKMTFYRFVVRCVAVRVPESTYNTTHRSCDHMIFWNTEKTLNLFTPIQQIHQKQSDDDAKGKKHKHQKLLLASQ